MVAVLVRLKLSLLKAGLRRSTWATVSFVIAALYGLCLAFVGVAVQIYVRLEAIEYAAAGSVVAFSALTTIWVLAPVLLSGIDDTLAVARFATLPVRARELVPGLLAAAFVGTPAVATVLVALGQFVVWTVSSASFVAALAAVPLGVVTTVLAARVVAALLARVMRSRRIRELATVALLLVVSSGGIGLALISEAAGRSSIAEHLEQIAGVLGWTPMGWAWSVPAAVSQGQVGTAVIRLILAIGLAGWLWRIWEREVAAALCRPTHDNASGTVVRSARLLQRVFGVSPTGVIALRTLSYRRRDPRQLASTLSAFGLPFMVAVALSFRSGADGAGLGDGAFIVPLFLGFLIGVNTSSDLSYDGPALWLHVTAGIPGTTDRWGRVLGVLVWALPALVVLVALASVVTGSTRLALPVLAASLALALGGLATSTWVGAYIQIPVAAPGANPLQQPSGGGAATFALAGLVMLGTVVSALPALVIALLAVLLERPELGWVALVVSLAIGAAAIVVGVRQGGRRLDERWPEILQRVA
ncbi:MAG: hypothetical protein CSA84_02490 [Actinomycetales bacterium]|nr:MAG: hypothetical protein CSA84_02490 [Actinomycetales bacterium]